MVEKFEEGKTYIFKKEKDMLSIRNLWFNKDMANWFDEKPRMCTGVIIVISTIPTAIATFEGIKNGYWNYIKAMKYFHLYISYKQEEMEL